MAVKREKWLHVRLSDEERAAWQAMAAAEKLTVADLIRQKMGESRTVDREPKKKRAARRADPELIQSMGRVGSNLNQLARWANTHAGAADAGHIIKCLLAIDQTLSSYRPNRPVTKEDGDDS